MTSHLHNVLIGLTVACLTGSITSASAAGIYASKAVWDGHLQKVMAKNLDAVMADFTDASVIVTPDKVYSGTAEVRGFIGKFIEQLTPEAMKSMIVQADVPHDNIVFTKFTVGKFKRTFVYTAEINGNKITTITTTNFAAE